jgi:hypothetical protein
MNGTFITNLVMKVPFITLGVMYAGTVSGPGGTSPNRCVRSVPANRRALARASTTCAEGLDARPCSSRVT